MKPDLHPTSSLRPHRWSAGRSATTLAGLVLLCGLAQADDHGKAAAPVLPLYKAECTACHVAYPPSLLPAASWQRLMQNLPRHFGTDASLDPAATAQLKTWLQANAGSGKRTASEPPEDRITRGAWFLREHREIGAATWKQPSVKSASNCAACHTTADQGDFSERHIRVPR